MEEIDDDEVELLRARTEQPQFDLNSKTTFRNHLRTISSIAHESSFAEDGTTDLEGRLRALYS